MMRANAGDQSMCDAPHSQHRAEDNVTVLRTTTTAFLRGSSTSRACTVIADDATTLAVHELGPSDAAVTVVCVHGHCLDGTTFGDITDIIAARWGSSIRVVTYDHRGHGRSGSADVSTYTIEQLARDLTAVLRTVAPAGPVVLVGHSMGGMTVLRYVRQHPEEVGRRIVAAALIASAAGDLPAYGLCRTLRTPVITWFTASAKACPVAVEGTRQMLRRLLSPVTRTPGIRMLPVGRWVAAAIDAAVANRTPIDTVAGFLPSLRALDEYGALDALARIPVAVVCGTHDPITPLAHTMEISARTASAEVVVVPDAGHMVITDRAGMVAQALDRLLVRATRADSDSECG